MFKKIVLTSVLVLFFLTACTKQEYSSSNVMSEKITLHNLKDIAQKIKAEPAMTKEEIELFTNGLIRLGINKDSVVGKTVLDIIKSQKEFVMKQTKAFCETTASRVDVAINHKFAYVGYQALEQNGQQINAIIFEITNLSDKDIRSVRGQLNFYTPDNQLLKVYNLITDRPIKPGELQRFVSPFTHDKNNQRDEIFRNSKDLRAIWVPMMIEFVDGSRKEVLAANGVN